MDLSEGSRSALAVELAEAEGLGIDTGLLVRLGEGVGDFVAVVFHFAVQGMGDIEFQVSQGGAERRASFEADLADDVYVFVGTGGAGMTMSFALAERTWKRWTG